MWKHETVNDYWHIKQGWKNWKKLAGWKRRLRPWQIWGRYWIISVFLKDASQHDVNYYTTVWKTAAWGN